MEPNVGVEFALLVLFLAFLGAMAQEQNSGGGLTVYTDKDVYSPGDTIIVSGTVARVVEGERLLFRLYDPLGALARSDQVEVSDNGTYRYQFPTGGPNMRETGGYRVVVNYDMQEAEIVFDFFASEHSSFPWTIVIDGNPYVVRYQILGGRVLGISGNPESKSITVAVNVTREEGVLRIQFGRDILEAQNATTGQDVPFVVLIDDKIVNFTEIDRSTGTRALEIPFVQGQSRIEIIGTWLVPEFHTIAALTLGVSISLIFLFRHAKVSRRI